MKRFLCVLLVQVVPSCSLCASAGFGTSTRISDTRGKAQEFLITTAEGDKHELGHCLTPR